VDLLRLVGSPRAAGEALDAAVARFPESPPLHERFRARALEERGIDGLQLDYDDLEKRIGASPPLDWFRGYASLVAAEFRRRAGSEESARAEYGRALERLQRSAQARESFRDSAYHYVVLALAGRGRSWLESGDLDHAVDDLAETVLWRSASLDSEDGLGRTPRTTLGLLREALEREGRRELRERLESKIAEVDPELASRPAR
jgi:hypothetical protein